MRRLERREFQPSLATVLESEKKTRDVDWWWGELNKSERVLNVASVEDALTILGDSKEFSVQLTNEAMGNRLAYVEARRYGTEALVDTQYQGWPTDFQSIIQEKLSKTELGEKLTAENWTLRDLCHRFVDTIAQAYGFESRYWMTRLVSEREIIDRSIAIGAYLLKQLMEKNGWEKDIDALLVTSAVLPEDLSIQIVEFARKKGFLSEKTKVEIELRDIRLACNSMVVAMQMASEDPVINTKKKVAILSLDPLGDMMGIFENVWSLGQFQLPVFGNGFVATGLDATQISGVEGSKIVFEPDTTRFTRYYKDLTTIPELADNYSWIEDPEQMLTFTSVQNVHGNHQAILLNLPSPLQPGIPVESDRPFNYARMVISTWSEVVLLLKDSLGVEALSQSLVVTNASSLPMSELLRKKFAMLLGLKVNHFPVRWISDKANSSTASWASSLLHKDVSIIWQEVGDYIIIIGAGTGIGASLALFAWKVKKKKRKNS